MQYRKDKKGNNISLLGFGCMRFEGGGIGDYFQKANDQVMEAIRQGINYFDTAYVYKNNEKVLGRILAENKCRDQIYIATKLPQYMVRSISQAEKIFPVAKKIATALKKTYQCDGVNILQNNGEAAGQTVFHLHVHVIPRYCDDDVNIKWKQGETPDLEAVAAEIKKNL